MSDGDEGSRRKLKFLLFENDGRDGPLIARTKDLFYRALTQSRAHQYAPAHLALTSGHQYSNY